MEEWFSLPASVAPTFAKTDNTSVTMAWVLTFDRAKTVYDAIFDDKAYVNPAAQREIAALLKRLGKDKGGAFDFKKPVSDLDPDFDVNFRVVGGMTDSLDDLNAALHLFTLRVVVGGSVTKDPDSGRFTVYITDVGVHVRDSYDFVGDQSLGCWNACTNSVGRVFCGGVDINNTDFDAFRKAHGVGGDLKILSNVKATHLQTPETFVLP
jgi:hypothetical protein